MRGHFVHPFDDDDFISGNGTIGLEIVEDLPDVDAVIAPLGGGGLLAGIACALSALRPDARVYAAEPETAAPLVRVARSRRASRFDGWQASFVDGAGGTSVLPDDVAAAAATWVADSIVVTLDDAARAMRAGGRPGPRDRGRRGGVRRRRRALASVRRARPPQGRRGRLRRQHRSRAVRHARRRVRR